jgi:hypothetical protein
MGGELRNPRRRRGALIEAGDLRTERIADQLQIMLQRELDGALRRQSQRRRLRLRVGGREREDDESQQPERLHHQTLADTPTCCNGGRV